MILNTSPLYTKTPALLSSYHFLHTNNPSCTLMLTRSIFHTLHTLTNTPGFDKIVLFDRHAVGGEYGAGWRSVGEGRLVTTFFPEDGSSPVICDDRVLKGNSRSSSSNDTPLLLAFLLFSFFLSLIISHTPSNLLTLTAPSSYNLPTSSQLSQLSQPSQPSPHGN